jgi:formylglycine-generating enzyme required for sulfatase activity
MDAMEITKAKWDEVAAWGATNGYTDLPAGGGKTNNHPVHTVNWYDCVKWSNARSEKEGLTPAYYIDPIFFNTYKTGNINISNDWVNWNSSGYRLPTEAEWEKAARGSRQQKFFPWGGNTIQHTRANYIANTNTYTYDTSLTTSYHPAYLAGGFPYTSPVGSFPANGYKLYDMAGNVAEWCWDWDANYSSSYQTDPRGPVVGPFGDFRIARGGSWNQDALRARCARRDSHPPGSSADARGFRCVKGP